MAAQLTRAPESISKRRPDAPPALAALLTRCLAKNPADRPQTATEIVSLLDSLEISSGAMTPLRAFTPRRVWILGGLVTAAAVSAIALWPRQDVQPTSVVADSTPAAATAPALTREDSLAIAAAIQQKLGEQQTTVTAKAESAVTKPVQSGGGERAVASAAEDLSRSVTRMVDSLRAEIQKAVLDSVTRVRGAPQALTFNLGDPKIDSIVRRFQRENERRSEQQLLRAQQLSREAFAARMETLGPPRRVFVSYPTLNSRSKFLAPQVDSVVDSLRRTLARDPRYVLIPEDSVRAMLARTRTISAISDSMNVELFASVGASVLPDTSVIWQVTSRDLTAHSAYMTRAVTMHGFKPDVLSGMDSLVTSIARFLKEQDRAPRRSLLGQNR